MKLLVVGGATVIALLLIALILSGRNATFMRGQTRIWNTLAWVGYLVAFFFVVVQIIVHDLWWLLPGAAFTTMAAFALNAFDRANRYLELFGPEAQKEEEEPWPTPTSTPMP